MFAGLLVAVGVFVVIFSHASGSSACPASHISSTYRTLNFGGRYCPGYSYRPGHFSISASGYNLTFQTSGNLVLYHGSSLLWSSHTGGKVSSTNGLLALQKNGELIIYSGIGDNLPVWSTGITYGYTKSTDPIYHTLVMPSLGGVSLVHELAGGGSNVTWSAP